MPIQTCQRNGRPGYRWGEQGHCYTYTLGDEAARSRARALAERQGRVIEGEAAMGTAASGAAREVKTLRFKASSEGLEPGEFAGYASTFGGVDLDGDIIERGAFAGTLNDFEQDGVIAWQHRWDVPIGKPIEVREDEHGLWLKGRISQTEAGIDALTLLRDGVIQKMSIGYEPKGFSMLSPEQATEILGEDAYRRAKDDLPEWRDQLRLLTEIKLFEVSLVTIPANPEAIITGVKAGDLHTRRDLERVLRDAGYSRKEAVSIAAQFQPIGQRDSDAGASDQEPFHREWLREKALRRQRSFDRCTRHRNT